MVNFSTRIIIVGGLTLANVSLIFVGKMCVFVSRPMKNVPLLRKNGDLPKRVVDFLMENTHSEKVMEIVERSRSATCEILKSGLFDESF